MATRTARTPRASRARKTATVDGTFYTDVLDALERSGIPYALGGAFAVKAYTGVHRDTKDIDVVVRPGDFTRVMAFLHDEGFETEVHDGRWLGKASRDGFYADIIFASVSGVAPVTDEWLRRAHPRKLLGREVRVLAPEELIYSKVYVQDRHRYDGADINHLILKVGAMVDWRRLLGYMDQHWELLFAALLNYLFVYPNERETVPPWLIEELARRSVESSRLSKRQDKICRGPLLSYQQYEPDVQQWGYKSITI